MARIIEVVTKTVIVVSSVAITFLICFQVVRRYVFLAPLLGLEEIALMVVLWLWFFSIVYATSKGFHISGGLPMRSQSAQRIMEVGYSFFSLIITVIFSYLTLVYCLWVAEVKLLSLGLYIPQIYSMISVFLGLVLVAGYLIREAVVRLRVFQQMRRRDSQ